MAGRKQLAAETTLHVTNAVALRLIGLLLERPRPGWWAEVHALAREVRDRQLQAAAAAAETADERLYLALLGPGGRISPRHASYIGVEDPGRRLALLRELYEAFGYRPVDAEDPPDHIAVEVSFAAFLSLKAAWAIAAQDGAALAAACRALECFVADQLGPFATVLLRRLDAAVEAAPHLRLAATALVERLARRGAKQAVLELRPQ